MIDVEHINSDLEHQDFDESLKMLIVRLDLTYIDHAKMVDLVKLGVSVLQDRVNNLKSPNLDLPDIIEPDDISNIIRRAERNVQEAESLLKRIKRNQRHE